MLRSGRPWTANAEYSKAIQAENRVPYMFDALAMTVNVIVVPHRLELGAEPAEFLDERFYLRSGSRTRCVHPERAHHEPRHAFQ
jgi:hypothetical protein